MTSPFASTDLLGALRISMGSAPIRHIEQLPARAGITVSWPAWVPADVVAALGNLGIAAPWQHQVAVADLAHGGSDVVIATGTASGKSLGYQLPVLAALGSDPEATALYLSPTKALAADQLEWWHSLGLPGLGLPGLGLPGIRPGRYDGDTPLTDRDWARDYGQLILTNPDMLHLGMLPNHARWRRLLRNLRYVVIDECHYYRGVFGSHVALVIRRLRRLARYYGADPVFVLASATVANPGQAASRLIGSPVQSVIQDAAPHPGADFVLFKPEFEPESGDPGDSVGDPDSEQPTRQRSVTAEAAQLMATMVAAEARTLTFVRSRAGAEVVALAARRILGTTAPHLVDKVSAYRGGYLPEDRRELETAFESGKLAGVASTNALELGVDISGIDAVIIAGYPGTLASMWQQSGRAGRAHSRALAVFIAREDPLDSYLVAHPEAIFAQPVEAAISDPTNPYVLRPQLACAAAEMPLTDDDFGLFSIDSASEALTSLIADTTVRQRPGGYFFTGRHHPAHQISLRGSGSQVAVVEGDTGRLLGSEDAARAPARVHPGAVYLHQGRSYSVTDLNLDDGIALVQPDKPDWSTMARSLSAVDIIETVESRELADGVVLARGRVRATEQVVGYVRRRSDGTLIDTIGLDLPEQTLDTRGVWYTVPTAVFDTLGIDAAALPGTLHAAEHAAIGMLPLFAGCDRSDIGGLSTAIHADTGQATVIVYDGLAGGAGFADQGFSIAAQWLAATYDTVRDCGCRSGCPSCVQSPKCGNGNNPLDKAGAMTLLNELAELLGST